MAKYTGSKIAKSNKSAGGIAVRKSGGGRRILQTLRSMPKRQAVLAFESGDVTAYVRAHRKLRRANGLDPTTGTKVTPPKGQSGATYGRPKPTAKRRKR